MPNMPWTALELTKLKPMQKTVEEMITIDDALGTDFSHVETMAEA